MPRAMGLMDTGAGNFAKVRVDPALKREAMEVLEARGITMSDLMRETLALVVRDRDIPFAVRQRSGRMVEPGLQRTLVDDNLPELHKRLWAEQTPKLEAEIEAETDKETPDEARLAGLEAQISRHYANRFKPETSRAALMGQKAHLRGIAR